MNPRLKTKKHIIELLRQLYLKETCEYKKQLIGNIANTVKSLKLTEIVKKEIIYERS